MFDSVVASLEVVGCQSVQIQVMKSCPIINVDKTDGVQVRNALDLCAEDSIWW